jgi:hypothetical protein
MGKWPQTLVRKFETETKSDNTDFAEMPENPWDQMASP